MVVDCPPEMFKKKKNLSTPSPKQPPSIIIFDSSLRDHENYTFTRKWITPDQFHQFFYKEDIRQILETGSSITCLTNFTGDFQISPMLTELDFVNHYDNIELSGDTANKTIWSFCHVPKSSGNFPFFQHLKVPNISFPYQSVPLPH